MAVIVMSSSALSTHQALTPWRIERRSTGAHGGYNTARHDPMSRMMSSRSAWTTTSTPAFDGRTYKHACTRFIASSMFPRRTCDARSRPPSRASFAVNECRCSTKREHAPDVMAAGIGAPPVSLTLCIITTENHAAKPRREWERW